jgi:hypothetical protein
MGTGTAFPLCVTGERNNDGLSSIRTVAVDRHLSSQLKPHQQGGVQFMWSHCFADFATHENGNEDAASVGGCVLAHSMGLVRFATLMRTSTICALLMLSS